MAHARVTMLPVFRRCSSQCLSRRTSVGFHVGRRTAFYQTATTADAGRKIDVLQTNPLKQAFTRLTTEGGPASLGLWQMLPGANISRALARTPGIDWVLVDCEHGQIDDGAMHEIVPVIAAEGASPIVRIPDFQPWMVKRALDSGAHGIVAPLIRTVEEVKALVEACKFPPHGRRGFGSPLAMQGFRARQSGSLQPQLPTFTEYLDQANGGTLVLVQIETQEALDRVEAIAPLVDALFVGPFDLANNIGHPIRDGVVPQPVRDALARTLAAATAAGRVCGVYAATAEQARDYAAAGFGMVNVSTDVLALQAEAAGAVAVARG